MKSFSDSGWFLYGCNGSLWGNLLPSLGRNHLDSNTTEKFLRDWGRRRPQMRSKIREMARPHLLPSYAGYQKGRELDLFSDGSCRVQAVPSGMTWTVSRLGMQHYHSNKKSRAVSFSKLCLSVVETAGWRRTGFPLSEGFQTVQGFTCIVGVIQQVRQHCSFTGLPGVPTSRTPLKTEWFKQKRTSTLGRGLKKGQGFLLMSCFQQAELPFLEGVQIGKSCDACKRALQSMRSNAHQFRICRHVKCKCMHQVFQQWMLHT